jgi:hypothetical protein
MGEVKQFVDGKIAENKVMVFGKSYCPVRSYVSSLYLFDRAWPSARLHRIMGLRCGEVQ